MPSAISGAEREQVALGFEALQAAEAALAQHRSMAERGEAERAFIEHAVAELRAAAPVAGEEEKLARQRQLMMNAEQFADAVTETRRALDAEGSLAPTSTRPCASSKDAGSRRPACSTS